MSSQKKIRQQKGPMDEPANARGLQGHQLNAEEVAELEVRGPGSEGASPGNFLALCGIAHDKPGLEAIGGVPVGAIRDALH